jgi:molecular chaperone GrpE
MQKSEETPKETGKIEPGKEKKVRKSKYAEEIVQLKMENQKLQDLYLRKAAEFDNYKKRTERESILWIQNANEQLIIKLLPVLDDMERSLSHIKENNNTESITQGTELIYKKLLDILDKEGLKPMTSVGEIFDPEKHDALIQVEKEGVETSRIIEEHLKGYYLNDKVVRHAQVIVAK